MAAILTIPENDRRERFIASGGQTVFPFDFPIYQPEHLAVYRLRAGAETLLAYGADYAVTGAGDQGGGNITLTAGALAADVIVIRSDQPTERTTSFANGGDLTAEALNAEYNRIFIEFQENEDQLSRTIRIPESDAPLAGRLPPASQRANGVLGFDNNGAPAVIMPDIGGDITPAYLQLLITNAINQVLPREIVVPYAGSVLNIPEGWQLCDGSNGTPDLRDRFIVAAGPIRAAGTVGGADTVTSSDAGAHSHGGATQDHALTEAQMPPHTHPLANVVRNAGSGGTITGLGSFADGYLATGITGSGAGHAHVITAAPNHSHTVDTVPAYYALAFIARTGFFVQPADPNDPVPLTEAALRDPIQAAMSDEVSVITTGTQVLTLRVVGARRIRGVRANLRTASTSGVVTVDINLNGASILSTKLTIDANERTSVTAAVAAVLTATTLADDDEVTFDIDTAGTGAIGLKVAIDTEFLP